MAVENVWEEAEILPMAIRLRKCGKCPPSIDAIYGEIIIGIVTMATKLMPEEDPIYARYLEQFLDEEVQAQMVLNALNAAEKYVDDRKKPRNIVNYLVKAVQNRLRNWVRDTTNRRVKAEMVQIDDVEYCEKECDLVGAIRWKQKSWKNFTKQKEN